MTAANAHLDYIDYLLDHRRWLGGPVLSLADLTAAALLYPLVLPPEGPSAIEGVPASAADWLERKWTALDQPCNGPLHGPCA